MEKKRNWSWLILLFVTALSCSDSHTPVNTDSPDLVMDFESEPLNPMPTRITDPESEGSSCLKGVYYDQFYRYQICSAPTCPPEDAVIQNSRRYKRKGNNSLRFFLRPSPLDSPAASDANHRVELGPNTDSGLFPSVGDECWYAFSVYFPEDFVFAPEDIKSNICFSIAQWQHGSVGSPAVSLIVYGDEIALGREEGISAKSQWQWPITLANISKGEWMDFVLQIKWLKTKGYVKVWLNNEIVCEQDNVQTVYDDLHRGGGFKFGLYYWRWKRREEVEKTFKAGIKHREIFIDEVKQYKGQNGYSVVSIH